MKEMNEQTKEEWVKSKQLNTKKCIIDSIKLHTKIDQFDLLLFGEWFKMKLPENILSYIFSLSFVLFQ